MKHYRRAADLRKAVASHLQAHGAQKWRLVQQQFPEISERTFWREVKGVRDAFDTVVDLVPLEPSSHVVECNVPASGELTIRMEMTSPTDFFAHVQRQFEAIDALEQHCVEVIGGQPRIQNPVIYNEVIKQRAAAINLVGKHWDSFLYVQKTNDFIVAVSEELKKENVELVRRVYERLKLVMTEFEPEAMANGEEAKREQRALERRARMEELARKAHAAKDEKLEASEWSGRSEEVQSAFRRRLVVLLEHCQFSDSDLEWFFETPTGTYLFQKLRRGEPPILDTFRLQRLAYLKVQPNIRINMDWIFSETGDALLPVSVASDEQRAEARRRSSEIAARLGSAVLPKPPARFERFFKNSAGNESPIVGVAKLD
jgi:hypothetical protein